jgi:hypothetical protein
VKKLWVTGFALLFGALEVHAECTVNLKAMSERAGRRYNISWSPVAGADTYVLEESFDNFRTVNKMTFIDRPDISLSREFAYQASVDVRVKYRVTASSGGGLITPCSAVQEVTYSSDAAFRKVVQKSAIPLVGSTPGLNGSQFKTSVRLRATENDQRGTLILRRNGIPGTERDPKMTYALAKKGDILNFDDIVAAFGQTGLGSIDIIPDPTAGGGFTVPFAEVRLFNVAANGTFGTIETQTQPFHWSNDVDTQRGLVVTAPKPNLRLNLGVRSFTSSVVLLSVSRAGKSIASVVHTPGGDSLLFGSAKEMLGGLDLEPGDVIRFGGMGTFVPMYTLTDNTTNDPALFIPPMRVDLDVESYIEK